MNYFFKDWMQRMKIMNVYKVLVLLTALLLSNGLFAQSNKVLIINSDNSIYKYQENANEFKKILVQNNYQWSEIDLADRSNTAAEEELKSQIQKDPAGFIYCIGTKAYALARDAAKGKKLLFSAAINWRKLNIGADTYGIANELAPSQEMSLLRYFFPSVKKIGLLYADKFSREYVDNVKQESAKLGLEIVAQAIESEDQISGSLDGLFNKIDIFWIISDPIVLNNKEAVQKIFETAAQYKKPVYAYSDVFVEQGAVLAISADVATIGRQSANFVMMIDNRKLPAGTVQIPAGSTVTLNKCVVDGLQLNFNKDALDSVNQLINCK
jgi:putative tryptophan/tyrosine transport system substrate-binding protein